MNIRLQQLPRSIVFVAILFAILLAQGCASTSATSKQTTFATPEAAVEQFVSALRANDKTSFHQILGEDADALISASDPVANQQRVQGFLKAYDEKHELELDEDGYVTLYVGNDDWPFPIPVIQDAKTGQWRFDTESGKVEILSRVIGQNELDVIEVCRAIVDAQKEYAIRNPNNALAQEYAQRFISSPGKKDGLFWPAGAGEAPSPLGPFVAIATEEGYKLTTVVDEPQPYHGYYYRMLTSQGSNAPGGARDFVVNGKMIGGFAAIAFPSDYGKTGIMSFMVSHDGVVYQKDLGPDSDKIARSIEAFDPGGGWTAVPREEGVIGE